MRGADSGLAELVDRLEARLRRGELGRPEPDPAPTADREQAPAWREWWH